MEIFMENKANFPNDLISDINTVYISHIDLKHIKI